MMEKYQKEERGVQIIELENAYQMCTKKEMYEYLIKIAILPFISRKSKYRQKYIPVPLLSHFPLSALKLLKK